MVMRKGANHADDRSRAIAEILSRTYEATSSDGRITVSSLGEAKLHWASVDYAFDERSSLNVAATEAGRASLTMARTQTARAMAELPGLNPQLRALLLGGF